MSDPIKNDADEQFINDIVQHEVDVITDSDWFNEKITDAIKENENV